MKSVDVVIPCYNYGHFLSDCVNSVLTQEGVKVRVLIIDDCSTDNSPQVGTNLAGQDERIEFRRHTENLGHIATYNEGLLGWASADYSLLLSADDALVKGALARAVQVMEQDEKVGMTYGLAQYINGVESFPATPALSNEYQIIPSETFLYHCFAIGNALESPTAVVRTKLQQSLGGYDPELPHSGDMEMWMRFAANGPVGVVNAVQAYYRIHDRNMSHHYYNNLLRDSGEVIKACEKILTNCGDKFPASKTWRKIMYRRMIEKAYWVAGKANEEGDKEGFLRCVEFVNGISRNDPFSKFVLKLRVKQFLGLTLWKILKTSLKYLPDFDGTTPGIHALIEPGGGRLNGWWPHGPNDGGRN